ncbi:MAG TPA: acetyl-CoA carboxylase, carboxyltransferase subunit beta [Candidatus Aquicultor sp.]|jgi:acetyl-CoA carboxylase carboxyl transferase subunit beta
MPIGEWFAKQDKRPPENPIEVKRAVPDGVWEKCDTCNEPLFIKELDKNLKVCPKCEHHFQLSAHERISHLIDPGTFEEEWHDLAAADPLSFEAAGKSYVGKLEKARNKTGLTDAVVCGTGHLDGYKVAIAVMDFRFMGGSMGSVAGEKIARTIELATKKKLPVIIVASSGGARMQEGMVSLMQMAKTSAALANHNKRRLPYISVLANPTSGGVTASFAMLADVIIAEPEAFIGFTGPRVIEQTIRQKLPKGFQTAESNLAHGMVDMIVNRIELKRTLSKLLGYFEGNGVVR